MKNIADSTDFHPPAPATPPGGPAAASETPKYTEKFAQATQASNCMTFGEKTYSGVFDWGINFGVNLIISAGFTQWVKHSKVPMWKNAPVGKDFFSKSPESAFNSVRGWMQNTTKLPESITHRMADALTLTTAGTAVMVPSVWIGAKIKPTFVESLDRWWYGKETVDNDPWIQHRHDVVDDAPKASLVGTVIGRAGTMLAVQAAAIGVGDKNNAITLLGNKFGSSTLKQFKGFDHYSKKIGHAAGMAMTDIMPGTAKTLDNFTRRIGFGHSTEQIKLSPKLVSAPYTGALADYSRYSALDTMYTLVTMGTIHPIINMVKNVLPGMTYKDESQRPKNRISEASRQGLVCERNREVSA